MLYTCRAYARVPFTVHIYKRYVRSLYTPAVSDPDEGVCADPVNGGAILGRGKPEPQGGNKERQLRPDKEREKT